MREVIKYLDTGAVKHYFYTDSSNIALCGKKPIWYLNWKWDKEVLKKRRICRGCSKIRREDNAL